MTDYSGLINQLRAKGDYEPLGHLGWEAADTIEALARRIAELEDALKMAADDLDAAAKFTNFNVYHIAANQARAALKGEK